MLEASLDEVKKAEATVKELAAAIVEVIASDTGSYNDAAFIGTHGNPRVRGFPDQGRACITSTRNRHYKQTHFTPVSERMSFTSASL
jgi:hypothetical protein